MANQILRRLVMQTLPSGRGELHSVASPVLYGKAKKAQTARLKLWDMEANYLCPIIGTCLTFVDLQELARSRGFVASMDNEYALHTEAVGWAHTSNPVSMAMQKLLDRRYQKWLSEFSAMRGEAELHSAWKACLERGEVAGAMWAAMTHKYGTASLRQRIFGDVHMLSHQVGAGQIADIRELERLRQENRKLLALQSEQEGKIASLSSRWLNERRQLEEQRAEMAQLAARHEELFARLQMFESGQIMINMGRRLLALQAANEQLIAGSQRLQGIESRYQQSQEMVSQLQAERDKLMAETQFLRRCLSAFEPSSSGCEVGQCQDCSHQGHCRSILYVGGRSSLVTYYRLLAEQAGCTLLHHDGGVEEALGRLPELIGSADAVICPTDCVSHSAYYQVKAHCKRAGKPCLFIQSASVSGFATALAQLTLQ